MISQETWLLLSLIIICCPIKLDHSLVSESTITTKRIVEICYLTLVPIFYVKIIISIKRSYLHFVVKSIFSSSIFLHRSFRGSYMISFLYCFVKKIEWRCKKEIDTFIESCCFKNTWLQNLYLSGGNFFIFMWQATDRLYDLIIVDIFWDMFDFYKKKNGRFKIFFYVDITLMLMVSSCLVYWYLFKFKRMM